MGGTTTRFLFDSSRFAASVEIGAAVITEVKLEIVCIHEERVPAAVELIRQRGRTGQSNSGWIYISNIDSATPIEE